MIEERPLHEVPAEAAVAAMLEGIAKLGLAALPWNDESRDLQARMEFVRKHAPEAALTGWPAVDDAALAADPAPGSCPGSMESVAFNIFRDFP